MIADSSVLILFARAERLDVLAQTLGPLEAPGAVLVEAVEAAPETPDARALAALRDEGSLEEVSPPSKEVEDVQGRYPNLGRGETEVLAAALARGDEVVLLDEVAARQAAVVEGLEPVGTLGVLARAYHEGHLADREALQSAVRDVLEAGLWVSADVVEAFWDRVGGRP